MNLEIAMMMMLAERDPLPSQEERDRRMAELNHEVERPNVHRFAQTRALFGIMLIRLGFWVLGREHRPLTATQS